MAQSTVGRYEIREELGRGGMAVVYRAFDPHFKREVALKVMAGELLEDARLRARFEREAQTIAAMEHPAIVPVYDFGEDDGHLFLVMRLMTGETLADRLRQGPLPVAECASLLERIGSALDRAHSQGVIHRDIKPSNILFDQYGDPYLADFGIARVTESSATLTGESVIGTPAYMSPEQVYGDRPVDGRSDIYSLGVVCYEMLTGRQPFKDDTPARVMMKHVMAPTPSLRAANPHLPADVEAVVTRAMAKESDARFATAGELARAMRAAATTAKAARPIREPPATVAQEVAAPSMATQESTATEMAGAIAGEKTVVTPAPGSRAQKGRSRRALLLGALALVLLLVVAGTGALLANRLLPGSEASAGDMETAATADEAEAVANGGEDAQEASGDGAVAAAATPRPTHTPQPTPSLDELLQAADEYLQVGDADGARQAYDTAIALQPDDPTLYVRRAETERLLGDPQAAVDDYSRAVELDPQEPAYYAARGSILRDDLGDAEGALEDHQHAVELAPKGAAFQRELAQTLRDVGEPQAALAHANEAISLEPDNPENYAARGQFYYMQGDLERAIADYDHALMLDPQMADVHAGRGIAYRELGEPETALGDFGEAIALRPDFAPYYEERALTYRDSLEDPETALPDFEQAVMLDPDNPDVYLERAVNFIQLQDAGAALADLGQCLARAPDQYWCYWHRAWLHDSLGEIEQAVADFQAFLDTVYEDEKNDERL
jgi:serine/threonine-protein kinase